MLATIITVDAAASAAAMPGTDTYHMQNGDQRNRSQRDDRLWGYCQGQQPQRYLE